MRLRRWALIFCATIYMLACSNAPELRESFDSGYVPETEKKIETGVVQDNNPVIDLSRNNQWIFDHLPQSALDLIETALNNNRELQQAKETLSISEKQYQTASRFLLPDGNLSIGRSTSRSSDFTSSSSSFGLDINWNIDVWNDLGVRQRNDIISLKSAFLSYESSYVNILSNVLSQWINLTTQHIDLALDREQLDLLRQLHKATNAGYIRGLYSIEDVISFQNRIDLSEESLGENIQRFNRQVRGLQLNLGQYPDGKMDFSQASLEVMPLSASLPTDFPTILVSRRTDIQQVWYSLLASDLDLAVAHRNRFPSFNISVSAGFSSDQASLLLDKSSFIASLAGNTAMQILKRDDLRRAVEQAESSVRITELSYQNTTFNAFLEVEQLFENEVGLYKRYESLLSSEQNAIKSEAIEVKKYLNRESGFLEVINAQETALDIRRQLNGLKSELLQNRLSLYVAMGGNLNIKLPETKDLK